MDAHLITMFLLFFVVVVGGGGGMGVSSYIRLCCVGSHNIIDSYTKN